MFVVTQKLLLCSVWQGLCRKATEMHSRSMGAAQPTSNSLSRECVHTLRVCSSSMECQVPALLYLQLAVCSHPHQPLLPHCTRRAFAQLLRASGDATTCGKAGRDEPCAFVAYDHRLLYYKRTQPHLQSVQASQEVRHRRTDNGVDPVRPSNC